jgi:hypothetical protein
LPKYYYYYIPQIAKAFQIYNAGHCSTGRKLVSIPDGVTGIFHCHNTTYFRPQYGLGVDSASNRNKYMEYFLEVKAADE